MSNPQTQICPKCNEVLNASVIVCFRCGNPLPAPGLRTEVVIDVAEFLDLDEALYLIQAFYAQYLEIPLEKRNNLIQKLQKVREKIHKLRDKPQIVRRTP